MDLFWDDEDLHVTHQHELTWLQWQNFHDICRLAACVCYLPESVFFLILVAYIYTYIYNYNYNCIYWIIYREANYDSSFWTWTLSSTTTYPLATGQGIPSHPSFPVQVIRQKAWCLSKSPQVACVNHWEMVCVWKQVLQSGASELLFKRLSYVYRLVQVYLQVISHLIQELQAVKIKSSYFSLCDLLLWMEDSMMFSYLILNIDLF